MAKNKKTIDKLDKEITKLKKEIKLRGQFENTRAGKKIDSILNDKFIEEIRGNGKPSILEKMRNNTKDHEDYDRIKKEVEGNGDVGLCEKYRFYGKILAAQWSVILILVYLSLGGSFKGITWEKVKENLGITTKTEQVEPADVDNGKKIIITESKPDSK
jgi:hypothetical protein